MKFDLNLVSGKAGLYGRRGKIGSHRAGGSAGSSALEVCIVCNSSVWLLNETDALISPALNVMFHSVSLFLASINFFVPLHTPSCVLP